MTDEGIVTNYRYDELDRLLETVSDSKAISYEYDKRGNIAKEYTEGLLKKPFTFDATSMLSKVVDAESGEATYSYNGMGKRVAVQNPTESIDYLLDLTKDYHNMLERTVNGESETYTYDSNVVSMSKSGNDYFYMLDELGTGMYLTGTDGMTTSTYAYDEFGRNINPFTGKKEKPAYTKQGNIIQPLAFTGYQHDEMIGSYFAQARYYDAGVGRFVSEDKVRGFIDSPESINHYLYCLDNPVKHIDMDGNCPMLIGAGIGALAGGIIGGGATIASSLIKGEDVNWKEVGKNAAIGAASGAVIGSGVGLVSAAAGALGASAAVTTGIAVGGGTFATGFATTEAVSQVSKKQDIDMGKIATAGALGAGIGMMTGATMGVGIDAYFSYKAAQIAGGTSIAVAASYANNAETYSSKFMNWLSRGNTDNKVYFGIDNNGVARYVGITKQAIENRLYQRISNGKPFDVLRIAYDCLTRNQARAIEQYFIENGPNELNKINSISKLSEYYEEAIKWAEYYISTHCGD